MIYLKLKRSNYCYSLFSVSEYLLIRILKSTGASGCLCLAYTEIRLKQIEIYMAEIPSGGIDYK